MADEPKDDKGGEKKPKFPAWVPDATIKLILVLVTAGVTYGVTKYGNRLRSLRYVVSFSPAIFQKPDIRGQQIKISVGDKPIDNLSTVGIQVYNTTDTDFEDVPVTVLLRAKEGKPSVLHVRTDFPSVAPTTQPTEQTVTRYDYQVKVANRGEKPVFSAEYFVEGAQAPEVAVSVTKKGLEMEQVPVAGVSQGSSQWASFTLTMLMVIALFFTGAKLYELYVSLRRWQQKDDSR